MKSQISTKSLRTLRAALPTGGVDTIAERLNLSPSTVSKILNGHTKNVKMEVVETALKVIEESRAKASELENKIASLS